LSLEDPPFDPAEEVAKAWAAEIDKRVRDVKEGRVRLIPVPSFSYLLIGMTKKKVREPLSADASEDARNISPAVPMGRYEYPRSYEARRLSPLLRRPLGPNASRARRPLPALQAQR
jgi:hypothetical protein